MCSVLFTWLGDEAILSDPSLDTTSHAQPEPARKREVQASLRPLARSRPRDDAWVNPPRARDECVRVLVN